MLKWLIIIALIALFINGAVHFSTTEEFFSVNFHIEKTMDLYETIKTAVVGFFNS